MAAQSKLRKNLTDTLKLLARKLTYAQYRQVLVTIDSAMCGVEFGYDDTSIYKFFSDADEIYKKNSKTAKNVKSKSAEIINFKVIKGDKKDD